MFRGTHGFVPYLSHFLSLLLLSSTSSINHSCIPSPSHSLLSVHQRLAFTSLPLFPPSAPSYHLLPYSINITASFSPLFPNHFPLSLMELEGGRGGKGSELIIYVLVWGEAVSSHTKHNLLMEKETLLCIPSWTVKEEEPFNYLPDPFHSSLSLLFMHSHFLPLSFSLSLPLPSFKPFL